MQVYVDTSALIALAHKRDFLHKKAVAVYEHLLEKDTHFLTTNAVLLEVGNTFSRVSHKAYAVSLFSLIKNSPTWETVFIDEDWFTKGLDLFNSNRSDPYKIADIDRSRGALIQALSFGRSVYYEINLNKSL